MGYGQERQRLFQGSQRNETISVFLPIHNFFKHLFSSGSTKKEYEPTRTGLSPDSLARALRDNLFFTQGKIPEVATHHDWYAALAYTVRDRLLQRWIKTVHTLCNRTSG